MKAPAVSKDELRVQLEKAQNTIATLRAKAREATKAAKDSASQITDLESRLAKLEKKTAPAKSAGKSAAKPSRARGRKPAETPAEQFEDVDHMAENEAPAEHETSDFE